MFKRTSQSIIAIAIALSTAGCSGGSDDDSEPDGSPLPESDILEEFGNSPDAGTTEEDDGGVTIRGSDTSAHDADRGADGSDPEPVADRFSGWWTTRDGEGSFSCGGEELSLDAGPEGRIEVPTSDTLTYHLEGSCSFEFSLSGRTATVKPGESCERQRAGSTERVEPKTWRLTLKKNSDRIEQTFRADVFSSTSDETESCESNWEGTLEPGPGPEAFVEDFVGTWSNENAMSNYGITCSELPEGSQLQEILRQFTPVGTAIRIEKNGAADLSVTTHADPEAERNEICAWSATARFRKATIESGAECRDYLPFGSSPPPRRVETSTYELNEAGDAITHEYRGTLSGMDRGERIECTEQWTVTYERSDGG